MNMKSAGNTTYIEYLLGENFQHLNALSKTLIHQFQPTTIEEYLDIQDATQCILYILLTWLYFEKDHSTTMKQQCYIPYNLNALLEQKTYKKKNIWAHIYATYIKATHTIPLFSSQFLPTHLHTILLEYSPPADSLLTCIRHIEGTLHHFPKYSYKDIPLLYEFLSQYTIDVQTDSPCWKENPLYAKYTGTYYTPTSIATELAHYAYKEFLTPHDPSTYKCIDISCGTGNILLSLLDIIAQSLPPISNDTLTPYYTPIEGYSNTQYDRNILIKRYIIDTMLYGVDINPIALGICSFCLQYESFIEGSYLLPYTNIRCGNALYSISYTKALPYLSEQEQLELAECYQKYHHATIQHCKEEQKNLYPHLYNLFTKALIHHVSSKSTYTTEELYSTERYIHYELEFPEVFFLHGGFTLSIGNPPWEKTKIESTLIMEQYHKGYSKESEERKLHLRTQLHNEYTTYHNHIVRRLALQIEYHKACFPMSKGMGDDNLYRYFIEHVLCNTILKDGGYLLYIIPTGFLMEESSTLLRSYVMEQCTVRYCVSFENRNTIFPTVDSRYKFAILGLQKTTPQQDYIEIGSLHTFTKALDEYTRFPITYSDIITFSHGSYALPEIQDKEDSILLGKIYALHPPLDKSYMSIRRELDCASNRSLFHAEQSEFADTPLYQGAMIWHYNNTYAPAKQYVSSSMLNTLLQNRELYRLYNDVYHVLPTSYKKKYRYMRKADAVCSFLGITKADMLLSYTPEQTLPRFAMRAIARNTDERSVITALLPPHVTYQNSLFASIAKTYTLDEHNQLCCIPTPLPRLLYTIAIFNALVYDWLMRFISAINISKVYIHKIPFPQPPDEDLINEPYNTLIQNTIALHCFHSQNIPYITSNIRLSSQDDVLKTQVENDILVAQLYHLSHTELEHITSKKYFAVLHKKKPFYREALLDAYR